LKSVALKLIPLALLTGALLASGCGVPPGPIPQVREHTVTAEPGWQPPVPLRRWEYVVVHHSATRSGGAVSFDRYHRKVKRWQNGLGYHFVIGNGTDTYDGQVEVGNRWLKQITGAHCGGRNNIGKIGICLVGHFEQQKPTPKQMRSLHRLLEYLQVRCGIPASKVRGHLEVCRPGYTKCPGRHFDMTALRTGLLREPPAYDPSKMVLTR
jgi:N-acetylmuramoyl-L-alanine amidase